VAWALSIACGEPISQISWQRLITPATIFRHGRKRAHRDIIEHRLVDVAKAILDPRHDITLELMAALLTPSLIFRPFSHSSNDTVFDRLVTSVADARRIVHDAFNVA
jgi:hypothetical protein